MVAEVTIGIGPDPAIAIAASPTAVGIGSAQADRAGLPCGSPRRDRSEALATHIRARLAHKCPRARGLCLDTLATPYMSLTPGARFVSAAPAEESNAEFPYTLDLHRPFHTR